MGMPSQVRLAAPQPIEPRPGPAAQQGEPAQPSPTAGGVKPEAGDAATGQRGQAGQGRPLKLWWEAQHLTVPVCTMAGGPPFARHLAATSRAFRQAINEAWGDLVRRFPPRLYVVGGLDSGFQPLKTATRFDPLVGAWQALPNMAVLTAGPCAAVAGGRLYVLGGEFGGRALRDAQRFDPWLEKWEALPPMHFGRIRAGAVACKGHLYVFGGLDGSKPLRSAERYNPRTRTWEVLAEMHSPRYACAAATRGGLVFAFGGELTDAGMQASLERYNPEVGVWELLPSVRPPSCGSALVIDPTGTSAYTIGGLGLSGQALPVAERMQLEPLLSADAINEEDGEPPEQPVLPSWGVLPQMPTPRHLASAAAFRGGAVAVGGKGATFEAVCNVELFNPATWSWEVLPALPSPRIRAAVVSGNL